MLQKCLKVTVKFKYHGYFKNKTLKGNTVIWRNFFFQPSSLFAMTWMIVIFRASWNLQSTFWLWNQTQECCVIKQASRSLPNALSAHRHFDPHEILTFWADEIGQKKNHTDHGAFCSPNAGGPLYLPWQQSGLDNFCQASEPLRASLPFWSFSEAVTRWEIMVFLGFRQ